MNTERLADLRARAASGLRSHEAAELLAAYDALRQQVRDLKATTAETESWRHEYRLQAESLQITCDEIAAERDAAYAEIGELRAELDAITGHSMSAAGIEAAEVDGQLLADALVEVARLREALWTIAEYDYEKHDGQLITRADKRSAAFDAVQEYAYFALADSES